MSRFMLLASASAIALAQIAASQAGITTFSDEDAWTANFASVNVAGFEPGDGLYDGDEVSDQYEGVLFESLVPWYAVPWATQNFAYRGEQSLVVATTWKSTTQPRQMTFVEPVQGFALWT